jgi:hypothetical protein
MMAEFEADFLVLVFQVAELVEKLGLDFVQPFVDLVLTEVDTFDLDLTVLTEYSPAQTQGYRFQQPNVSQQNQPSGQQNYQYQQQGQIQNQGQIQQNQGQPQPQIQHQQPA